MQEAWDMRGKEGIGQQAGGGVGKKAGAQGKEREGGNVKKAGAGGEEEERGNGQKTKAHV